MSKAMKQISHRPNNQEVIHRLYLEPDDPDEHEKWPFIKHILNDLPPYCTASEISAALGRASTPEFVIEICIDANIPSCPNDMSLIDRDYFLYHFSQHLKFEDSPAGTDCQPISLCAG